MSDDWKPREHDDFVEPMFAGLGAKRDVARAPRRRAWRWIALAIAVISLVAWLVVRFGT